MISSMTRRLVYYGCLTVLTFTLGVLAGRRSTDTSLQLSVSRPAPRTTTIEVPVPVLTERVVTQVLPPEDLPTVTAILKENENLRVKVHELSVSLATYESQGGGPIAPASSPFSPPTTVTRDVHFKDWRLEFTSNQNTAQYTLRQQFAIVNTVGRDRKNTPTHVVRLYEVEPNGARTPIPITQTSTIAAAPNLPAWALTPRITAGVAYINRGSSVTARPATSDFVPTGVLAISWLRRQRSTANEDATWAVLSPAVTITDTSKSIGILPVSYNLGSLPKQPFTNLWVSPYIGSSTTTRIDRLGFTLTATF